MLADVQACRQLGAHGVVLGCLRPDGTVDAAATQQLVQEARAQVRGVATTWLRGAVSLRLACVPQMLCVCVCHPNRALTAHCLRCGCGAGPGCHVPSSLRRGQGLEVRGLLATLAADTLHALKLQQRFCRDLGACNTHKQWLCLQPERVLQVCNRGTCSGP
jgi:hypothetical protein